MRWESVVVLYAVLSDFVEPVWVLCPLSTEVKTVNMGESVMTDTCTACESMASFSSAVTDQK